MLSNKTGKCTTIHITVIILNDRKLNKDKYLTLRFLQLAADGYTYARVVFIIHGSILWSYKIDICFLSLVSFITHMIIIDLSISKDSKIVWVTNLFLANALTNYLLSISLYTLFYHYFHCFNITYQCSMYFVWTIFLPNI